jgi:hypothetical protein
LSNRNQIVRSEASQVRRVTCPRVQLWRYQRLPTCLTITHLYFIFRCQSLSDGWPIQGTPPYTHDRQQHQTLKDIQPVRGSNTPLFSTPSSRYRSDVTNIQPAGGYECCKHSTGPWCEHQVLWTLMLFKVQTTFLSRTSSHTTSLSPQPPVSH